MSDVSSPSRAELTSIAREVCRSAGLPPPRAAFPTGWHVEAGWGLGLLELRLDALASGLVAARLSVALGPLLAEPERREEQMRAGLWLSGLLVGGRCTLDPAGDTLCLEGEMVTARGALVEDIVARIGQLRLEERFAARIIAATAAGRPAKDALRAALAPPPRFDSAAHLAAAATLVEAAR